MDSGRHADENRPSFLSQVVSFLVMLALALLVFFGLRTFVIEPYDIPSGSMETTIMTGDRVFAEKVSYYFRDVQPGDIVTFNSPEVAGQVLIKRCIATAGQTVDLVDGAVFVDGQRLDEPYTHELPSYPLRTASGEEISYPYTVPDGYIWVMGDNRTNSSDSRYFGPVPEDSVTGRGCLVFWPLDHFGLLE